MRKQQKTRSPKQRLALFSAAVLALIGGYYWGNQHTPRELPPSALSQLQQPRPIQSLQLLDQFGSGFTEQRLHGRWNLLFFGYSNGDSARGLLTLATQVVNRLADRPDLQDQLRVIFVTLDPDRDRPEDLRSFVGHYHPNFLALTGPADEIQRFARELGVRFERRPQSADGDYQIDHGTSMALIDPDARLRGLFTGVVDAVTIATDFKQIASVE